MEIIDQHNRKVKIHNIDIDKIAPQDALKKVAKHKAECPHMLAADPTVSHIQVCTKYHC